MTRNPDSTRLERLLDEALTPDVGGATDAMVQRIMARTTPLLGSQAVESGLDDHLDEALAMPVAPRGLVERIVRGTRHAYERHVNGVLFRIGDTRIQWAHVRALAAGFVLAASVGIVIVTSTIFREAGHIVVAHRELAAMVSYRGPSNLIDHEIELLSMQVDQVAAGPVVDTSRLLIDQAIMDLESQIHSTASEGVVF